MGYRGLSQFDPSAIAAMAAQGVTQSTQAAISGNCCPPGTSCAPTGQQNSSAPILWGVGGLALGLVLGIVIGKKK